MSKPVYLYRAVTTVPLEVFYDGEPIIERPGMVLGRQTGYLSRSAAVEAGRRAYLDPDQFAVVRSEPVEFLSDADKLRREIQRLTAQLAAVEAVA